MVRMIGVAELPGAHQSIGSQIERGNWLFLGILRRNAGGTAPHYSRVPRPAFFWEPVESFRIGLESIQISAEISFPSVPRERP
jgi:hypothetical protein